MFGAFQTFGKLGAIGKAIAAAWSPLALWPDGIASPGMWIDPSLLTASFNDYTGTTPVATPGSVADSANPVGLALDIRAGATTVTDPGNHMLQATAAARPLESARVNLLTKTDALDDAATWIVTGGSSATRTKTATDPFGVANNAWVITFSAVGVPGISCGPTGSWAASTIVSSRVYLRMPNKNATIYLSNQGSDGTGSLVCAVTDTWQEFTLNGQDVSGKLKHPLFISNFAINDVLEIFHPSMNSGPTALPYQRVNTASDYSATGVTPFQLHDGVDDSMATASFAAGTLINGMDCMIPVRRDAGGNAILCFDLGGTSGYFGLINAAAETAYNCGTPTVFVDNVQLAGGTLVMGNTLASALPLGELHIVEFRNLDLSTWTRFGMSGFAGGGYLFNGARGDIMLYPSTASTEDKDAARQYLADKYGVALA